MGKFKNPPRPAYKPVLATSRDFADDLHELWAGGHTIDAELGIVYDPVGFAMAFEHVGRQMVLRSLTDEEVAALGLQIMVSP